MISLALTAALTATLPNLIVGTDGEIYIRATWDGPIKKKDERGGPIKDGDTGCLIAHGVFGGHQSVCVRVEGLDCPEINKGLRRNDAEEAWKLFRSWARAHPNVYIRDTGRYSFRRVISPICPPGGADCLTEYMISTGICKAYEKKKRKKR